MAANIIDYVGGKDNIESLVHCVTRLRFVLKDNSKANKKELEKLDIIQVLQQGGQYQIVIGQNVSQVYDAVVAELGSGFSEQDANVNHKKVSKTDYVFDMISGTFAPLIPAIMGSGLLKAAIQMLSMVGWLSVKGGTYAVLSAAANAVFYFLPILLGVSFGRKLKVSPYIAGSIGAALLEPNIMNLVTNGKKSVDFIGINIPLMNYSSTVVPIILAIIMLKFLDIFLKRFIPKSMQSIVTPMLEIGLIVPVTMMLFGPVGVTLGNWIAALFGWAMVKNAIVSCALFGLLGIGIVSLGLHWAVIPVIIMNLATKGWDPLLATVQSTAYAAAGIALGVAILHKKDKQGQSAIAAFASALFAGITEPVIYGIYFKYRKTWIYAGVAGLISGIINGVFQIRGTQIAGGIFVIPTYSPVIPYAGSMLTAMIIGLVLVLIFGLGDNVKEQVEITVNNTEVITKKEALKVGSEEKVSAPVNGHAIRLSDVSDQTFASGGLGEGFAIEPTENTLYAPVSGTVTTVFPTKHAIGITSDQGVELLIHLGIDTVKLNGKHFNLNINQGDHINQGDKLGSVDFNAIKQAGFDDTVMVIVLNSKDISKINIDLINKLGNLMTLKI